MSIFFSILACFIFGFMTLAGLILLVVGLAGEKKGLRTGGAITLGVGLILLLVTIFYMVNRTVEKVKGTMHDLKNSLDTTMLNSNSVTQDVFEDDRTYLLTGANPNPQLEKIKSYIPDEEEKNIEPAFFTYFGGQNGFRFPMVYPYAIHCDDVKEIGTLVDERNVTSIKEGGGTEENMMFGVTHLNYDGKMLLIQTTNKLSRNDEQEETSYYIFDYATRKFTETKTEKELYKKALKLGYKGEQSLMSINEYDLLFQ